MWFCNAPPTITVILREGGGSLSPAKTLQVDAVASGPPVKPEDDAGSRLRALLYAGGTLE